MKRVIFDLVRNGIVIVYPDNIKFFSNTVIADDGLSVICDYSGDKDLTLCVDVNEKDRQAKIKALQDKFQSGYDAYLANYPQAEVASFNDKKNEALAYNSDNTAPTPIIDAIILGSVDTKADYIASVLAKVQFLAVKEGEMVKVRDAIKACTTQDDLDAIVI